MSLAALAEEAGVSRQWLDQVARGEVAAPPALTAAVDRAIQGLGVRPKWALWQPLPRDVYRRMVRSGPRRDSPSPCVAGFAEQGPRSRRPEFVNFSQENWDFWKSHQRRSPMLPEEALRHFGLAADPFEEPQRPDDLWPHPQLETLRGLVRRAIMRGAFLLVDGPSGSGKTLAVRYAVGQLAGDKRLGVDRNPKYQVARLLTLRRRQTTGCSLPRALLRDLSPGTRPKANAEDLIAQVARIIAEKWTADDPQTCALLIEEAHELAPELWLDLKKVREICADAGGGLAVICIGQTESTPNLSETLALPELVSVRRRLHRFTLRPLSAAQARTYTAFRLERAGAKGDIIYPAALEHLLQHFSRGGGGAARLYPALLDTWLSTALVEAWDKGQKSVTKGLMAHVLLTGGGEMVLNAEDAEGAENAEAGQGKKA